MSDRFGRFLRTTVRDLGRQVERARRAFGEGRATGETDLERETDGDVRIVCRRYAERRSVPLDEAGRPACYEPGHPDCEGCAEDVREGVVETW